MGPYFRCSKERRNENDLYEIWLPYGNGSFVAPRSGTVKVSIFVFGYASSTNFRTLTAKGFGLTAEVQSYSGEVKVGDVMSAKSTGIFEVTEGDSYTITATGDHATVQRYGGFISYID